MTDANLINHANHMYWTLITRIVQILQNQSKTMPILFTDHAQTLF